MYTETIEEATAHRLRGIEDGPHLNFALEHFNEIMIIGTEVARIIGYAEDKRDCYLKVQFIHGKTIWHAMVGGYYSLKNLKGQNYIKSSNGEDWDDYCRLDYFLELNEAPKQERPSIEYHDVEY